MAAGENTSGTVEEPIVTLYNAIKGSGNISYPTSAAYNIRSRIEIEGEGESQKTLTYYWLERKKWDKSVFPPRLTIAQAQTILDDFQNYLDRVQRRANIGAFWVTAIIAPLINSIATAFKTSTLYAGWTGGTSTTQLNLPSTAGTEASATPTPLATPTATPSPLSLTTIPAKNSEIDPGFSIAIILFNIIIATIAIGLNRYANNDALRTSLLTARRILDSLKKKDATSDAGDLPPPPPTGIEKFWSNLWPATPTLTATFNPRYAYIRSDMEHLLMARIRATGLNKHKPLLCPAIDTFTSDGLTKVLAPLVAAGLAPNTLILIPCKIGENHWTGLVIKITAATPIIIYIDPAISGVAEVPTTLQSQVNTSFRGTAPKIYSLAKKIEIDSEMHGSAIFEQTGPYTIENMMQVATKLVSETDQSKVSAFLVRMLDKTKRASASLLKMLDKTRVDDLEALKNFDLSYFEEFNNRQVVAGLPARGITTVHLSGTTSFRDSKDVLKLLNIALKLKQLNDVSSTLYKALTNDSSTAGALEVGTTEGLQATHIARIKAIFRTKASIRGMTDDDHNKLNTLSLLLFGLAPNDAGFNASILSFDHKDLALIAEFSALSEADLQARIATLESEVHPLDFPRGIDEEGTRRLTTPLGAREYKSGFFDAVAEGGGGGGAAGGAARAAGGAGGDDAVALIASLGTVVKADGKGNCFFHAIASELGRQRLKTYTHEELRAMAVQHLREHPELLEGKDPVLKINGTDKHLTPDEYCTEMLKDGTYAEGAIIDAMAMGLNIQLTIVEPRKGLTLAELITGYMHRKNEGEGRPNIFLILRKGEHYDVLVPHELSVNTNKKAAIPGTGPTRSSVPLASLPYGSRRPLPPGPPPAMAAAEAVATGGAGTATPTAMAFGPTGGGGGASDIPTAPPTTIPGTATEAPSY